MIKKRLGVNIDHVATIRNARGEIYPDPLRAALIAQKSGADSVTIHLREDRRHIRDYDLKNIIEKNNISIVLANVDPAAVVLAKLNDMFPELGIITTNSDTCDIFVDKKKTNEICMNHSIKTIPLSLKIDYSHQKKIMSWGLWSLECPISTMDYFLRLPCNFLKP